MFELYFVTYRKM